MEVFAQYGLGGLALGVVVYVAKMFTLHVEKKDAQFVSFLGNHMSSNTKALQDLTEVVRSLRDEVARGR